MRMGIVIWIVVGLTLAIFARRVMPGPSAGGLAVAIPLGVAGALCGGVVGVLLFGTTTGVEVPGVSMAVIGALLVLSCYRAYALRSREIAAHSARVK
jgi:uncharacterized membrane protein YeaQ/YmgE (transglycosylase-associated protein family)